MAIERFVTVATIEPCVLGDMFANIPPHITFCPPFDADSSRIGEYHHRMQAVMEENPGGIQVVDTEPALFGDSGDVLADKTWVTLTGGFPIHLGAFVGAQKIGSVDERYAGMNWNPHVSRIDGFELPAREFSLSEVQLFRKQPDGLKRVIAVYSAKWANILEANEW